MLNKTTWLAAIVLTICVLTACGEKAPEQAKGTSQSTATPVKIAAAKLAKELENTVPYLYASDGSCTNRCMTKEQAEIACNVLTGYSTRLVPVLAANVYGKEKALLEGGKIDSFKTGWSGKICRATIQVTGIFEGSSAGVALTGEVVSFVALDGEILAHQFLRD